MDSKHNSDAKIIVIGLDGVPLSLLRHLVATGCMPRMGELLKTGSFGRLSSVIPPITPPAWTSFQTGKYPFRHGIVDFISYTPWAYTYSFTNSTNITSRTIWNILSASGKKQIVVNVPLTYPPEEIDGIIIPGFDTPEAASGVAHPEGVLNTLEQKVQRYQFFKMGWSNTVYRDEGLRALVHELLTLTRNQVESVKFLMNSYEWDFLMYHFQVTDILQHLAWDIIDPQSTGYDQKSEHDKTLIREFYRKIDTMVGELIDGADRYTNICVLSDHGFNGNDSTFYINHFLREKGYIALNPFYIFWKSLDSFIKRMKNLHVPFLKNVYLPMTNRAIKSFRKILFRKTSAYAYSYLTNYAFLFINKLLEVDQDRLRKDLLDITHEGKRVVKDIYPWYEGRAQGVFSPDFVIEFDERFSVRQKLPSKNQPYFTTASEPGKHGLDGMFCLVGNNIKKGHETSAQIIDMMPTLLTLFHIPIPNDIDGKVIEDIFESMDRPNYSGSEEYSTTYKAVSGEDFDAVAERLKSLGYLQ